MYNASLRQVLKSCLLGRKVICLICINCSYNNIAKGIYPHDEIAIYDNTGNISYK